jgi:hypothetical protein
MTAKVKEVLGTDFAVVMRADGFLKARILASTGVSPVVGDGVLIEYLPPSDEWYIVAVL